MQHDALDPALADLVDRMMLADPRARPAIGEVHADLMALRTPGDAPAPAPPAAPAASPRTGALRGKLVGAAPAAPVAPRTPPAAPSSGLKGKLLGRTPREGRR